MTDIAKRLVHLRGLPTDSHSSYLRGAAAAPGFIRTALASDHSNLASERGTEIGREIDLVDCGDVSLKEDDEDAARITRAIAESLNVGAMPLSLGGDHSVTFPIVEAIANRLGPVQILHFDAHPDLYDDFDGDPFSHHMYVFNADGTMQQANPDAGNARTSDSDGQGIWVADGDRITGKFVEMRADRATHAYIGRGEISFDFTIDGDTLTGSATARFFDPGGALVEGPFETDMTGTRVTLP